MATIEQEGPPFLRRHSRLLLPLGIDLLPAVNNRVLAWADLRFTFHDLIDEVQEMLGEYRWRALSVFVFVVRADRQEILEMSDELRSFVSTVDETQLSTNDFLLKEFLLD